MSTFPVAVEIFSQILVVHIQHCMFQEATEEILLNNFHHVTLVETCFWPSVQCLT